MMSKRPSPRDWREARRDRALALKEAGWSQRRIAEALGVTEAAVSRWIAIARADGPAALQARPRPHGPVKLTRAQLDLLPDFLSHGAEAYGFRGEVWTCARVAQVIRQEFGVTYHKAHVSRLLQALDWTPQKPLLRAAQRNEKAIARWRLEAWPDIKNRGKAEANDRLHR